MVMDILNDVVVSLDAFVTAYNPAAVFFSTPVKIRNHMDKDESEDNEKTMKYDESTINAASELGLLDSDESKTRKFFFFQFPPAMPLIKCLATAEGKERDNTNSFDPKGKGKAKLDDSKSSHLKGKVGVGDTKSYDSDSPNHSLTLLANHILVQ